LRVLMLTYEVAGRGGSYIRAFSLARGLASLGHAVTLLAAPRRVGLTIREHTRDGVRVVELADLLPYRLRHGGLSPLELAARLRFVKHVQADVVHAFGHRLTVSATARACQRAGMHVIGDWADLWGLEGIGGLRGWAARNSLGRLDERWERLTYPRYHGLTTINSDLKRRAESFGIPRDHIKVIPVGADPETIRPLPQNEMRKRLGLPLDRPIVMHVGLSTYDAALLGRCFAEVAGQHPEALFVLVGRPMRAVREAMRAAGHADRLIEMGFVPYENMGAYLACGDVMVLPYSDRSVNRGRTPNKVGDYMAAARPVVTNPTGDMRRLVEEAGIGLLAEESPLAMAAAVLTLLRDPALRERLGKQARSAAEQRYSWRSLSERLADFYVASRGWRVQA